MEGILKSKLPLLLVAFCWGAAAGQPIECDGYQYNCTDGYYCDSVVFKCRKCINCAEFSRSPPLDPTKKCITSVVDCGVCFEGLTEGVQGLQCVSAPVSTAYVWVAIALGGVLLFVAAVAIVVYVLRNTDTFRVFASSTSLQPSCSSGPPASAPEPPPPYNTLYTPVRPESPAAPHPPHLTHEEAASPFIKRPPPPPPARERAGQQAANVYNNPSYVRGPHLPADHQTAEREPEPEFLHDESTAESPWRPGDVANNNAHVDNSESGSSSGASPPAPPGAPLGAQLAAARGATLLRAPGQGGTPSKVPRLRQDTNNNRNGREREDEETQPRADAGAGAGAGGATFNILVNVQQLNDVKL
ncbi:uncharacterized protein LOC133516996 [Cydia pomonella]|uniref:uncharacterized protein LOC133516996 n=1 Tax=Cydia pomonella TaxID=82600 RepID=UPI002ADE9139|nr:uncharacterized protein LOC133516996 [Cydia pomonella]